MGTFTGHLLPGLFFLAFGIRWSFRLFERYYYCESVRLKGNLGIRFRCTSSFPFKWWPHHPIEGYIKVICCGIGFSGELETAFRGGQFVNLMNSQHMAMFFFFGINGAFDILTWYSPLVPHDMDYLTMALAVFVEGLLFAFHLHGRSHLDIHVHQLLIVAIFATFVAVLVEWRFRDSVLSIAFRVFCILVQGSWFIQAGFILHNPFPEHKKWSEHDHMQTMLITSIYCVHLASVLFFMLFAGFMTSRSFCVTTVDLVHDKAGYRHLLHEVSMESLSEL